MQSPAQQVHGSSSARILPAPAPPQHWRVHRQPSQRRPTIQVTDTFHVTPIHDLVDHDTSTTEPDCVCGPEVRPATQEDGSVGWLLVHHSLDGREQADG
jgi:hypothetical protein